MDSSEAFEFKLLSLDACLRPQKGRPVPGPPPEYLRDVGVACLYVGDLLEKNCRLGQTILFENKSSGNDSDLAEEFGSLSIENRRCLAIAWPLKSVPQAYVALPEICFASLGIPYSEYGPPPKQKSPSKASPAKSRRSSSGKKGLSSPSTKNAVVKTLPNYARLSLSVVPTDHPLVARRVVLSSDSDIPEASLVDIKDKLQHVMIMEGHRFSTTYCGQQISATVDHVTSELDSPGATCEGLSFISKVCSDTLFFQANAQRDRGASQTADQKLGSSLGGLKQAQTRQPAMGLEHESLALRDLLWAAGIADDSLRIQSNTGVVRPRGALLYGPPGTGKTLLSVQIAEETNGAVELVNCAELLGSLLGDSERSLQQIFKKAAKEKPCVVVLDEVDAICVRRDDFDASDADIRMTTTLLTCMDAVESGVFVIGTTNRPDALDGAMRRAGRFDREIEVAVPSSKARFQILKGYAAQCKKEDVEFTMEDIEDVANVAYGYVGADLAGLWREAVRSSIARKTGSTTVRKEDLFNGLRNTKPSALRDVSVETPRVKWEDVGGNEEAKLRLKEAVRWAVDTNSKQFEDLGISPPAGVLLFGPPGCSKTLLAQAVATEAKVNFLSVKGPELLSKYVGDSEKAVRSIFRRARSVAPSLIFFDEVDALAGSRGRGGPEDRVLAQLLVEMDGIAADSKTSVVIMCATNRPDMIDLALLRPGRIDSLVYIGLPDLDARSQILRIHMRTQPCAKVNVESLAERIEGYSGAEIAALVREAALIAMEEDLTNAREVLPHHYETALGRVKPRTSTQQIEFYDNYIKTAKGVNIIC